MFLRGKKSDFYFGMEIAKTWTAPHFVKNKATMGNTSLKTQELERSLRKWNTLIASEKLLSKE